MIQSKMMISAKLSVRAGTTARVCILFVAEHPLPIQLRCNQHHEQVRNQDFSWGGGGGGAFEQ